MVGRKQQQGARQGEDLVSALAPALGGDSRCVNTRPAEGQGHEQGVGRRLPYCRARTQLLWLVARVEAVLAGQGVPRAVCRGGAAQGEDSGLRRP